MTQKEFFGNPKLAPLLTLACILAWAGAFPLIKLGYREIAMPQIADKLVFAGMRFTLAGVLAMLFAYLLGRSFRVPTKSCVRSLLLSLAPLCPLPALLFPVGSWASPLSRAITWPLLSLPVVFISSIEVNRSPKHKSGRTALFTCSSAVIFYYIVLLILGKGYDKNYQPRINLIPGTVLLTHFQSSTEMLQSTNECTTVPKPTKTTTLMIKPLSNYAGVNI